MARQITLEILADSSKFESGMKAAASQADQSAEKIEEAAKKADRMQSALDGAGGAADASESKFMGMADVLDGLGGAFGLPTEAATGMMRSFGDLTGGFAQLQPMIGGLAGALKGGLAPVLSMIAAHPIIFALVGLAALFVLLWKNSETFRDIVKGVFETVGNIIGAVWNWVKDNWPLLLGILTGPIGIAVALIVTHWDTIKNAFTAVKDWISDRIGDIVGFFQGLPSRLVTAAGDMFRFVRDKIGEAKDFLGEQLTLMVDFWKGLPGRIVEAVGDMFRGVREKVVAAKDFVSEQFGLMVDYLKGMPGRITDAALGMFDGVKNAFKSAINWIIEKWNGLDFTIQVPEKGPFGIPIPGGGSKFTLGVPDIPRLAAGGFAPAGYPAIVGELGPELFIPSRSGSVIPNGAVGSTVITVNMGVVGDPSQAARQIVGLLQQEQRRSGSLGLN